MQQLTSVIYKMVKSGGFFRTLQLFPLFTDFDLLVTVDELAGDILAADVIGDGIFQDIDLSVCQLLVRQFDRGLTFCEGNGTDTVAIQVVDIECVLRVGVLEVGGVVQALVDGVGAQAQAAVARQR